MSLFWKALGPAIVLAGACTVAPAQTPVSFTTHTQPFTASSSADISRAFAVDLNNDGVPDLVVPVTPLVTIGGQKYFTTLLSVSLAKGDGTFQPQREVQISSSAVPEGPLFFGDFNNDGKADIGMLVTITQSSGATSYEIAMLLGKGDGTFQPTTLEPVSSAHAGGFQGPAIIADFNHDGNQDLAAGNYIFPGDGKGNFGSPTAIGGQNVYVVAGGDFDGDGNADLAYDFVTGSPCTVHDPPCAEDLHVLYGDGKLGFKDVVAYHSGAPFDFRTGDVNSDGRTDIFLFDEASGSNLVVLSGVSNRTFEKFSMASGPVQSTEAAMADVNGDGHMDLVVYGNSTTSFTYNEYVVFLATGNGEFTRENVLAPSFGVAPSPPLLVDLNRDNKPDILEPAKTPENTDDTIVVALNQSTGSSFPSCGYPPANFGLAFCTPALRTSSPVRFTAAASSLGQTRKMELWVDGTKISEQYHAWGQRAWLDLTHSFSAGIHSATLFEGDTDNRLKKVTSTFVVGSCAAPASPGVHLCLPVNNGTTQSPVTVEATAKTTNNVARMEAWIDGAKKLTAGGSASLTAAFPLKPGKHRIVVIAVDVAGTKYSAAVNTTVQ
ncbi:MAG: VCBS repeat-containing protein [Acidobacteriaceae bacterium]